MPQPAAAALAEGLDVEEEEGSDGKATKQWKDSVSAAWAAGAPTGLARVGQVPVVGAEEARRLINAHGSVGTSVPTASLRQVGRCCKGLCTGLAAA